MAYKILYNLSFIDSSDLINHSPSHCSSHTGLSDTSIIVDSWTIWGLEAVTPIST